MAIGSDVDRGEWLSPSSSIATIGKKSACSSFVAPRYILDSDQIYYQHQFQADILSESHAEYNQASVNGSNNNIILDTRLSRP